MTFSGQLTNLGTKVGRRVATAALALATFFVLQVTGAGLAQAQSFSVLHTFKGPDGANPTSQVTLDAKGNIYGTTDVGGGRYGGQGGTVFELTPKGKRYVESVLYTFNSALDDPLAGVIRDAEGNFYGTTSEWFYTYGSVFELSNGQLTTLWGFTGGTDGENPMYADLVRDAKGNLYGVTAGDFAGSPECSSSRCGTVYKVDMKKHLTVLHTFKPKDGIFPFQGVLRDAKGNLYGSTSSGGAHGRGTVFELTAAGSYNVLYNFPSAVGQLLGGPNGSRPLVLDAKGNLYGATWSEGKYGHGMVFKVNISSRTGTELYSFKGTPDGAYPRGGLVLDSAGNLYGTTSRGGTSDAGTVFEVDTTNNETVLHNFNGGSDGYSPQGVVMDKAGNLYGAAYEGGDISCSTSKGLGCGTVFELTP